MLLASITINAIALSRVRTLAYLSADTHLHSNWF